MSIMCIKAEGLLVSLPLHLSAPAVFLGESDEWAISRRSVLFGRRAPHFVAAPPPHLHRTPSSFSAPTSGLKQHAVLLGRRNWFIYYCRTMCMLFFLVLFFSPGLREIWWWASPQMSQIRVLLWLHGHCSVLNPNRLCHPQTSGSLCFLLLTKRYYPKR